VFRGYNFAQNLLENLRAFQIVNKTRSLSLNIGNRRYGNF